MTSFHELRPYGGILLSLMIWSIVEGFGGPYGPGSTDVGAAIMYAFIFVAIIIVESYFTITLATIQ